MANFDHGPSARALERSCDRRYLAAHEPNAHALTTSKQFSPIARFMANFARTFRCRVRLEHAQAQGHSKPQSEERDFTNRIFRG